MTLSCKLHDNQILQRLAADWLQFWAVARLTLSATVSAVMGTYLLRQAF
jgi:hypothetical protein